MPFKYTFITIKMRFTIKCRNCGDEWQREFIINEIGSSIDHPINSYCLRCQSPNNNVLSFKILSIEVTGK